MSEILILGLAITAAVVMFSLEHGGGPENLLMKIQVEICAFWSAENSPFTSVCAVY